MDEFSLSGLGEVIDKYNIHLVNAIFFNFIFLIAIVGSLINLVEHHLPTSIRQFFRYGKHCHKGKADALVTKLEVPKSWFKHFYVFALAWSSLALFLMLKSFIWKKEAPGYVVDFLDFVAGGRAHREVKVHSTDGLVVCVLMFLQCARRFYETNFVQIFSKKSKINLSHYLVGYIHYFGAIIALLANTEGFVAGSEPTPFSFNNISIVKYLCILLFHLSWKQQYKSNMILVNLRKDSKTGKVATEEHLMPKGGFFEYISSPHMFFEIVMYFALLGLLWESTTWKLVVIWVFSNQFLNALLTHQWYKENFKNYPTSRKALIPFLI